MALSMIKSLKDTAGFVKALIEYLSLKNKELYSNSSGWKTGSKTIPGISKYKTVRVYFWSTTNGVLAERLNDTDESFQMRGASMMQGVSSNAQHTSGSVNLFCKGDSVEINLGTYMHHSGNSNHGGAATIGIVKIVGVEPIIPDALAEYIRGGYCVKLGGGLHAKLAKVLERYRQRMAEDFCRLADRQPENRVVVDSVGEHVVENDRHHRSEKYNVSNSIQRQANSNWSVYRFDAVSRFIQHYCVQHRYNKIYHGVQKQLQYLLHIGGCLACNRQGIVAARGCCYV